MTIAGGQQDYYSHSGKLGGMGLPAALICGTIAAVVLGIVYGYAIHYCPFIYINFLLTICFGAAVGWVTGKAAQFGNLRNTAALMVVGVVVGIVAVYVQWVAWIYAASEGKFLILSPVALFQFLSALVVDGVWNIFGMTPTGIFLWIIWGIEALMILGATVVMALTQIDLPFCERCQKWIDELPDNKVRLKAFDESEAEVANQIAQGDLMALAQRPAAGDDEAEFLVAQLDKCHSCDELNLLSVKQVMLVLGDEGKMEEKEVSLFERRLIDSNTFAALGKALASSPATEPSAPPEESPES